MPTYAAPSDLAVYMGLAQAPANAAQLLRSASLLVREATRQALYEADVATGLPLAPRLVEVFRDATCALASAYSILEINPQVGSAGFAQGISSKSLGSAAVSYTNNAEREASRAKLADGRTLTNECYLTLKHAGLISIGVVSEEAPGRTWIAGSAFDPLTGNFIGPVAQF